MSESKLEAELYESMRLLSMTEQGFPMPEREMHPFWCCEHTKRQHSRSLHCFACGCPVFDGARGKHERGDRCAHEYRHERDWRCDFVWPDLRLIVEVEGGVWTQGRHTRGSGFTKDIEKYNSLTAAGWKVLRFGRREVTSGEALNVITKALAVEESRP